MSHTGGRKFHRALSAGAIVFLAWAGLCATACHGQDAAAPWNGPASDGGASLPLPAPTSPSAGNEQSPGVAPWPWQSGLPSSPAVGTGGGGSTPAGDAAATSDFGGRGMGGLGPDLHPRDSFRYGTSWFPTVSVHGQAADFEMFSQDLSFSHPLWIDAADAWSLTGGVRNRLIDSEAVLPDTGQTVPADLWSVNLGLRYARQFDNGWTAGGGLSVGSASDHPFASIREMNVGANAMLRVPQNEHDAWLFSLNYSPTGELNFPLPGIAYSYNPSPQFHANIGLPFMMSWRPNADWQFQASYMLLRTVHVKAQYRLADWLRAVAAYDWSNDAYSLVDRPDVNDRFFIYDQRVSMGLEVAAMRQWTASLSAGYIFDRYLYEGTFFSPTSSDAVNLGSGPFAALNLGARF